MVAVLTGTFTLRFSTGLTGAALIYYLADLPRFGGQEVGPLTVGHHVDHLLVRQAAARVFGASKRQIYQKVVLPYTLPFVVSGIQLALSRGLVGVVIAEFLTGASKDGGLGWLIFRAARGFNGALTYAALMSLAIFALVLVQGTRSMEAKIAPWRQVSKA